MEEELLRTRTLAAVGEMSGEVARQIRNPLAGVSGFAEILARDLEKDPERAELVNKIQEGVAGVESAVCRLPGRGGEWSRPVPLSRRGGGRGEDARLFEAGLEEAEGVRVERRIGRNEALARIDEEQFSGALRRLLANARDAMPGGGVITVALDVVENPMDEEGESGGAVERPFGRPSRSRIDGRRLRPGYGRGHERRSPRKRLLSLLQHPGAAGGPRPDDGPAHPDRPRG